MDITAGGTWVDKRTPVSFVHEQTQVNFRETGEKHESCISLDWSISHIITHIILQFYLIIIVNSNRIVMGCFYLNIFYMCINANFMRKKKSDLFENLICAVCKMYMKKT